MRKYKNIHNGEIKTLYQIGYDFISARYRDSLKDAIKGVIEAPLAHPKEMEKMDAIAVGEEIVREYNYKEVKGVK
jgi:hypothetical protein